MSGPWIAAAQYLRMSTEHQRYSLANQASAISQYAKARGFEVTRSYFDPGKSGLTLRERKGLQALLSDALRPDREFDAILVLDVSRWGRFQDPDQSAHYEYLCREAGVHVVYCAEPFENDGSPVGTLVKQIKRLMAAEYSRELSEKITRARLQQARLGFHQGGTGAYGVRRLVVDPSGAPRMFLGPGERKGLATDRVILAPGPREELAIVRRIFRRFVQDRRGMASIARELNVEELKAAQGQPWNAHLVRSVLTNELMVGTYTFNKTVRRLKSRGRPSAPDAWVRVEVMKPIVARSTFKAAQERLACGQRERVDRQTILRGLKRLWREHGRISRTLINRSSYLPSAATCRRLFGNMDAAYQALGYEQSSLRWTDDHRGPADNDRILQRLRLAHEKLGYLNASVIEEDRAPPSCTAIRKRFGSLRRAYELAGLPHRIGDIQRAAYARSLTRGTAAVLTGALIGRRPTCPALKDEDLLTGLQRVYERHGHVSAALMREDPGLRSPNCYIRRFGSLHRAYELAGLPHDPVCLREMAQQRAWITRRANLAREGHV